MEAIGTGVKDEILQSVKDEIHLKLNALSSAGMIAVTDAAKRK